MPYIEYQSAEEKRATLLLLGWKQELVNVTMMFFKDNKLQPFPYHEMWLAPKDADFAGFEQKPVGFYMDRSAYTLEDAYAMEREASQIKANIKQRRLT